MTKIRILKDFQAAEGWQEGDVVEAAFDYTRLVEEGKVEVVDENKKPEPVTSKATEADVAAKEAVTKKPVKMVNPETEVEAEATKVVEGDVEGV